ncbi:hypothetical protein MYCOZU2_03788 [Mycobacterium intracellulare subsp. chimaera]|uniref:Uncharacterized protein n=2 Tax=Mycobacterium intracellulare TaxID=1767 RepID=A0A7U5MMB0_MYCIT|nr:Hypothetical protein MIP_06596 [Mycobacterium intracellulare subsp. intracellulare MTCC 9506]ASL16167.1 hypothetical protein MYCOZU2_03788 [Mycobacterium intracellulare subsp. chimaera]ETZ27714.1 hypothetical protein L842_4610 [Mycobacterium intracellulare MIN_052511_1280]
MLVSGLSYPWRYSLSAAAAVGVSTSVTHPMVGVLSFPGAPPPCAWVC